MKGAALLILCIILTVLVGAISGIATTNSIKDWYVAISKPFFNPPNYLFGPVWTVLYILMGISFFLILRSPKSDLRNKAIVVFCIQLVLNFCWSFIFFKFHLIGLAFVEIILIWLSIIWMILVFSKINKAAAYLQVPYFLWVSFASILNYSIWYLN